MSDQNYVVYHMLPEDTWSCIQEEYLPPTYKQDGFIHATAVWDLLVDVGNMFYKSSPGKEWAAIQL